MHIFLVAKIVRNPGVLSKDNNPTLSTPTYPHCYLGLHGLFQVLGIVGPEQQLDARLQCIMEMRTVEEGALQPCTYVWGENWMCTACCSGCLEI